MRQRQEGKGLTARMEGPLEGGRLHINPLSSCRWHLAMKHERVIKTVLVLGLQLNYGDNSKEMSASFITRLREINPRGFRWHPRRRIGRESASIEALRPFRAFVL